MKPCPYCKGRGSVSAERDTIRMTREEIDTVRATAVKTPPAPKPDGPDSSVEIPPAVVPFFGQESDVDEDEVVTPVVMRGVCGRCGGDKKIRCADPECAECASDHYCENSTVCPNCVVSAVPVAGMARRHDLLAIVLALAVAGVFVVGLVFALAE